MTWTWIVFVFLSFLFVASERQKLWLCQVQSNCCFNMYFHSFSSHVCVMHHEHNFRFDCTRFQRCGTHFTVKKKLKMKNWAWVERKKNANWMALELLLEQCNFKFYPGHKYKWIIYSKFLSNFFSLFFWFSVQWFFI